MAHNSFDLVPDLDKSGWSAVSHNYPHITGDGATEEAAVEALHRALVYFADNDPLAFHAGIRRRRAAGLECGCGYASPRVADPPMGFMGPGKRRT
jgi:hypothetical protein